ncbi:warthog protein 6 [Copidosoma floridanum]|uniref:warthog protein 6 n=1 Tax=Copidosoma floridanum TaxID=29053 RepID=UPI0006C9C486|nr:warthog protein 6 [Copidosoma floridanum]
MRLLIIAALLGSIGVTLGQYQPTTPVPILKQINRHNEDGSYSYGYEAADGSYKIESKHPTGEVYGKYGFIDDTGSLREIEYGATRRGFEPSGTGINVPPPTLHGNSLNGEKDDDDGQYREDPTIYYTDPRYTNGEKYEPVPKRYPLQNYQQPRPLAYPAPSKSVATAYRKPAPSPAPVAAQPAYQPAYQPEYQPQYRTQYQPQYQPDLAAYGPSQPNKFAGQATSNVNLNLGSYSVNYRR